MITHQASRFTFYFLRLVQYLRQSKQFRVNGLWAANYLGQWGDGHAVLNHADQHARLAAGKGGHRPCAEAGGQQAVEGRRRAAPLHVADDRRTQLKAEALLVGKTVDEGLARKCGELAAAGAKPIDDIRASAEYRRLMCEVLVRRILSQTLALEGEVSNLPREGD